MCIRLSTARRANEGANVLFGTVDVLFGTVDRGGVEIEEEMLLSLLGPLWTA